MTRWTTPLHFNGSHLSFCSFDDVGFSDESESLRAEHDGASFSYRVVILWTCYAPSLYINVSMYIATFNRIGVICEARLDPLQIEQSRAVFEFVDHPDRYQCR